MFTRTALAALLAAAALAALGSTSGSAGAAADTTPPQLNVPAYAAYVVGTQIGPNPGVDDDGDPNTPNSFTPVIEGVAQQLKWDAADTGSGICGYSAMVRDPFGYPNTELPRYSTTSGRGSWTFVTGNGGGSTADVDVAVSAYDCANNVTTKYTRGVRPALLADVGWTPAPGWSRVYCDCAIAGTMLRTTTKGASLSYSFSTIEGAHFALLMATGPARGKADVYFDGRFASTIDTYSRVNDNRIVKWDTYLTAGTHTVKVVNRATPGRARIDVDAYMGHSYTTP